MTLRDTISHLMVGIHRISPELAVYHTSKMSQAEWRQRFRIYSRLLGMELSAVGPRRRAVNVSSTRLLTPATTTAGFRHSTLSLSERQVMPESEKKATGSEGGGVFCPRLLPESERNNRESP